MSLSCYEVKWRKFRASIYIPPLPAILAPLDRGREWMDDDPVEVEAIRARKRAKYYARKAAGYIFNAKRTAERAARRAQLACARARFNPPGPLS